MMATCQSAACKGDSYGGHATRLDHQQQYPAIEECDQGIVRVAQISVLPADLGHTRGQFSPDKGGGQGNGAAGQPCAQYQRRRVYPLRDDVGIDEDSAADDSAHDQHGGVEESEAAG